MTAYSLIVPVYGQVDLTERCLDVLLAGGTNAVPYEIVVVDDGSRDRTPKLLAALGDRIRVVHHETNVGFARACNDGAAAASGETLIFLNNDTVPQPGWVDELARYAGDHTEAAIVGAKLLFPDDTVQHAGVVIDQYGYPKHIYAGFPAWHPATCRSRRYQAVTAACMLVRREVFERVGGFDPAFVNGYEDADLCLRAAAVGEVHYCAESTVYHLESMSEGRHTHAAANERLWTERWVGKALPDDFRYYAEDKLIGIRYTDPYPIRLDLSPLVAVVDGDELDRRADHLLGLRSRRSFEMTREIARLSGRPSPEVHRVAEGTAHWLSPRPKHRLVSVLVDAGDPETARATVAAVLGQRADEIVEVVALDWHAAAGVREALAALGATVVAVDDPDEVSVADVLPFAHGELVVVLAPEAAPANDEWLAPLVKRLDDEPELVAVYSAAAPEAGAAGTGATCVAFRADVVRQRLPAGLHPAALRRWSEQVVADGLRIANEPSSVVSVRELSALELVLRGAAEERLGGSAAATADDVIAAALARIREDWRHLEPHGRLPADELERERLGVCVRHLAEALGHVLERSGRTRGPRRAWIEDASAGRLAAGVWGEPA
jgi:GT2 family glycosyltransferase